MGEIQVTWWWRASNIFIFTRKLGKMNPFWRAYFSKGLVQPPTRKILKKCPQSCTFTKTLPELRHPLRWCSSARRERNPRTNTRRNPWRPWWCAVMGLEDFHLDLGWNFMGSKCSSKHSSPMELLWMVTCFSWTYFYVHLFRVDIHKWHPLKRQAIYSFFHLLVSVIHNHGDGFRPLRIGLWDPFQMAIHGL